MVILRVLFVVTIWILILSSCSVHATIDPIPNRIQDVNGNLHYYTMYRLTNINEPVRYCQLHEQWERVDTISNYESGQVRLTSSVNDLTIHYAHNNYSNDITVSYWSQDEFLDLLSTLESDIYIYQLYT